MEHSNTEHSSLSEVHQSVDTTIARSGKLRRVLAFFGPAYLVSVGYMDPGNWATDLEGGSKFHYNLIWVILMSNLMALLLQSLSARLGVVRGRDLAQANRETYPPYINYALYGLAEIAIAACDLAEVLGMAIGIQLLTGLPLIWGVCITVLDTFLFLMLQRAGMRKMEAFIIALVGVIGISFLVEILLAKPALGEVARGFMPHIPDGALYITIGIIGATVMPHNLYLHSALVQTRKFKRDKAGIKKALKLNFIDSAIALNLAFFVNAAILVLAGKVFFESGRTDVAQIKTAHELLAPMLGTGLAPVLFAIALIASGQSSTITGTLAGQIVMEGYLNLRIAPWIRRLLTRLIAILPAVIVILINGENDIDSLLILSQVILSLQLGFAIIPLIHFTSDKTKMGSFAIKPLVVLISSLITAVLVYLNIKMVSEKAAPVFSAGGNPVWQIVIGLGGLLYLGLLAVTIFYPFRKKKNITPAVRLHPEAKELNELVVPSYKKIAVALEFGDNDHKLLSYAIGQGNSNSTFVLIHVVESVSAKVYEHQSDDLETRKDQEQLEFYAEQLVRQGFKAEPQLGFRNRAKEIIRLVKESGADLLVIGAHGHTGVKDLIYGQTVNTVRHELKIPVLVVTS